MKLRKLIESCITNHIDDDVLERTPLVAESERETLGHAIENWRARA